MKYGRSDAKAWSREHMKGVWAAALTPFTDGYKIDEKGLHITHGPDRKEAELLAVDTVVLCAGQNPARDLVEGLTAAGIAHHLIGGADVAAELDAKRAIDQATRLAARL